MSALTMETRCMVELERLRGLVGAQTARVAELEQAAQQAGRRVTAAREALADFYRRREMDGDQAQGEDERALIDEVRDAEGGLTLRPEIYPRGGGQVDVGLDVVNPRIEAQLDGARQLLTDRQDELRAFAVEHVGDMAIERAPHARQVADQAEAALQLAAEAAGAYQQEHNWWAWVLGLTVGEGETAMVDVPANPFEGLGRGPVKPPLPEQFIKKEP